MSLALNMFSRRSSSLARSPFAMVPLLLLVLSVFEMEDGFEPVGSVFLTSS